MSQKTLKYFIISKLVNMLGLIQSVLITNLLFVTELQNDISLIWKKYLLSFLKKIITFYCLLTL